MLLALNVAAYMVIAVIAAIRLNQLHWRTAPIVQVGLWWWLGVSAFAGLVLIEREPSWQQVTLALSGAGLLVYHTQSFWRPWLAERRARPRLGAHSRGMSFHPLDDHWR